MAEPVARFLSRLPERTVRVVRLGLRAIEWAPFPWRFSRLSCDARSAYLARMESSRFFVYRDLLLLAKILCMFGWARDERVRSTVGYEARCGVADGEAPPQPGPLGELRPQGDGEECDVAIVGSGAGGAAAAATLAEAGLDVLVLESGPHFDHRSYPEDPLEAIPVLYRDGGMTVAGGRPAIPVPVGRALGGTTVINSGTCFRAPDEVLAEWQERYGVEWAPELEPTFAAAEHELAVTRLDPERMGRNGQLCMEGAEALGASGGPIARNAGACIQCSSCPVGCRLDAKRAMHVSYLPRAAAAGARIRTGVQALRLLREGERVTGIACRGGLPTTAKEEFSRNGRPVRGRPFEVRARAVLLAAGAFGTPELLLRSGIRHPHLGRHLHVHPAAWIGGRYEQEVRGWEGVMQSYYVDEWQPQRILLEATFTPLSFGAQWLPGAGREHSERIRDYDKLGSIGVHLHDHSSGHVGLHPDGSLRLSYKLRNEEVRLLQFGIARAAEVHFAAGAVEVYPNVGPVPVIKRGSLPEFESMRVRADDLRLEAFHPMSTARMGADPKQSVTAPDGSVHGTDGLYVADASLLPSSVGVNPMMTIIACATQVATQLAQRISARAPAPSPGG